MTDLLRGLHTDTHARTPIAAQERAFVFRNNIVKLWTPCRQADRTTVYDMQHLDIFNRLLNAEYEGASHGDMAQSVFGIDAGLYPNWAACVVGSHLERAHWLRNRDFPYLDW